MRSTLKTSCLAWIPRLGHVYSPLSLFNVLPNFSSVRFLRDISICLSASLLWLQVTRQRILVSVASYPGTSLPYGNRHSLSSNRNGWNFHIWMTLSLGFVGLTSCVCFLGITVPLLPGPISAWTAFVEGAAFMRPLLQSQNDLSYVIRYAASELEKH